MKGKECSEREGTKCSESLGGNALAKGLEKSEGREGWGMLKVSALKTML